jgi:hypothetical protein
MFNSSARFDAFRRHGPTPALALSDYNRRRARLPACAKSRRRLACYWQANPETSRLECHWKLSSRSAASALEQGLPAGTEATPAWTRRVA